MNEQNKIDTAFCVAKRVFGDLLVNVGVGVPCNGDVDVVLVLRKLNLKAVGDFVKSAKKEGLSVGCRAVTPLMIESVLLDGKTATMLMKKMTFLFEPITIDKDKLRQIIKNNLADEVSNILRAVVDGKYDAYRAIDLLVQLLVICQ